VKKLPLFVFALMLLVGCQKGPVIDERSYEKREDAVDISFSEGYSSMALSLPDTWESEEFSFEHMLGLILSPKDAPDFSVRLEFHKRGLGICGTGVTFTDIEFENGLSATECRETIGNKLSLLYIFHDLAGDYAMSISAPKADIEKFRDDISYIVSSLKLGGDMMSGSKAAEKAKKYCDIDYDRTRADFDYETGNWSVMFTNSKDSSLKQEITLDKDGKLID